MTLHIQTKRWQGIGARNFMAKTQAILEGVVPFNSVILDNPGYRKFLKPSNDTDLYIIIWGYHASNQITGGAEDVTTAWGVDIPWKQDIMLPSGQGKEIITPEGLVIAEFVDPNILHVFCNLPGIGSEADLKIYEEILYEVAAIYGYSKAVLQNMRDTKSTEEATSFLAKICKARMVDEKRRLTDLKENIELHKAKFFKLIKEEKEITEMLGSIENTMNSDMQKVKEEIEACIKMKSVKSIRVDKDAIIMSTDMIYIYHNDMKYKIGEFDIRIDPIKGGVSFANTTPGHKRKSAWGDFCHHPHISTSGNACWGNVASSVMSLINDNEYEALTSVLISYLESVNVEDTAGKYVTWWDVVDESDNIIRHGLDPRDVGKEPCHICGSHHSPADMYTCPQCGNLTCSRCMVEIRTEGGASRRVCTNCRSTEYKKCLNCRTHIFVSEGRDFCTSCSIAECVDCGGQFDRAALKEIEGGLHCSACEERSFIHCDFCDNSTHQDASMFCERCGRDTCMDCTSSAVGPNLCPECRGGN